MAKEKPWEAYHGVSNVMAVFTKNDSVQFKNVLQYEFINLSNVPVLINGTLLLDRYFSGSLAAPTITGGFTQWAPLMKAGERDTSQYTFIFQDNAFMITPIHRLYVVRKMYSPGNS